MIFTLEPNEAAFIIRVIGQLPTESKAYPLHEKLVYQFQSQDKDSQRQSKDTMAPGEPE